MFWNQSTVKMVRIVQKIPARMPSGDRREILKILKKHNKKRKVRKSLKSSKSGDHSNSDSSMNSNSYVNKDWENWVVMHGNKEVVKADVKELGKVIGVSYKGDPNNSFNLLSKEGRRGWGAVGGAEVEGGFVEGVRGECHTPIFDPSCH